MDFMSDLLKGFKSVKPNVKNEVKQAIFSSDTKDKQKKSVSGDKKKEYAQAFRNQWS